MLSGEEGDELPHRLGLRTSFDFLPPHRGGAAATGAASQLRTRQDHIRDGGTLMIEKGMTPLAYLQEVLEGREKPTGYQMQAATAMLPYVHKKKPVAVEQSGPDGADPVTRVIYEWAKPRDNAGT